MYLPRKHTLPLDKLQEDKLQGIDSISICLEQQIDAQIIFLDHHTVCSHQHYPSNITPPTNITPFWGVTPPHTLIQIVYRITYNCIDTDSIDDVVVEENDDQVAEVTLGDAISAISTLRTYLKQDKVPLLVKNKLEELDHEMRKHRLSKKHASRIITDFI